MSVVGAQQRAGDVNRSLIVVVEIHNPTASPLKLNELAYTLERSGWSDTQGKVQLNETVEPGKTAVVDISVPIDGNVEPGETFDLVGQLRGSAGEVNMTWKIAAEPRVGSE